MDERYFDEKKGLALDAIQRAVENAKQASTAIHASRYALPNLTNPADVHKLLQMAQGELNGARRDFEKSRWATADTSLEFDDWLRENGHDDLAF